MSFKYEAILPRAWTLGTARDRTSQLHWTETGWHSAIWSAKVWNHDEPRRDAGANPRIRTLPTGRRLWGQRSGGICLKRNKTWELWHQCSDAVTQQRKKLRLSYRRQHRNFCIFCCLIRVPLINEVLPHDTSKKTVTDESILINRLTVWFSDSCGSRWMMMKKSSPFCFILQTRIKSLRPKNQGKQHALAQCEVNGIRFWSKSTPGQHDFTITFCKERTR